ncbi:dsDNA nuclease domain-containing protein [Bacillus cereus]|uniref:dsDNA nuclease domain-containing protein n=1 Tax=Bacillus cereus TaxID=1396 RepID=UPI000BF80B57|nr:dsDNA nuclease domain-containing protein [Bacillus cereus]PES30319.1 hypothetical protein CN496_09430 [Bacillus cereus]PET84999.1 hypothetical protein CN528_06725 [Bacillus cereus]
MEIQNKTEISKVKLEKNIEEFLEENEEKLSKEEKQRLIDSILAGNFLDLSGVTAIRGFLYQYYVAASYIVDMLFLESAWWDKVVFEFLDDIAVMGTMRIRFIQVKTKRESDIANYLTLGDLHQRKGGKGSWLDKLFIFNTHVPEKIDMSGKTKKRTMIPNKKLLTSCVLQFELATNVQYNKDMAIYEKDNKFHSDKDKSDYQPLIDALEGKKKRKKTKIEEKEKEEKYWSFQGPEEDIILDASCYNGPLAKQPNWYLDRFRIKRYGNVPYLRDELIGKIKSNTDGNLDAFHEYKATIVLDNLLLEIITRTCQDDDNISAEKFTFHKEDLKKQFDGWYVSASDIANAASERDSIRAKFITCFERIEREIESSNLEITLHMELMDTMRKMRDSLDEQFYQKEDPFIYQRFLQRLFNLNNSHSKFPFDDSIDSNYLGRSIKSLIYLSVLYKESSYTPINAHLLFRKLLDFQEDFGIFSLHNVREKEDLDVAMKRVRISAKECSVSQDFNHDYYCFIADPAEKKKRKFNVKSRLKNDSINASISEPAVEEKDFQDIKITKQTENIKFLSTSLIHDFLEELKEEKVSSFKDKSIVELWKESLDDEYCKEREGMQ